MSAAISQIPRRISPAADNLLVMNASDRVWRERGLLGAVLAGDERAWRTWYEESFDGLYAYASWRCGGLRDLADEMVQETWLTAVKRIRSFEPERGSFAGWLRGIAANLIRNHWRGHLARNGKPTGCAPWTRAVQDPSVELEARERAQLIASTLASLPDHYEAVLRAKYLDQQSVAEIAESRNETPKAIESLLTRARQAFREVYERSEKHG